VFIVTLSRKKVGAPIYGAQRQSCSWRMDGAASQRLGPQTNLTIHDG